LLSKLLKRLKWEGHLNSRLVGQHSENLSMASESTTTFLFTMRAWLRGMHFQEASQWDTLTAV
jgi:hypothetical protein